MNKKLTKAVKAQKKASKQEVQQISGLLGIPINGKKRVEVPNRNGFVYVRLRNNQSEVIQAFNNTVSPSYDLPILVERQGSRYMVTSVDTHRYENNWGSYSAFVPRHGNQHSFDIESGGGGDIVWVYPRQFMPMLTIPSGSAGAPNVLVSSYMLQKSDGSFVAVGNTGTVNLTTYNPTGSSAVMGLVFIDTVSGNPGIIINSGTYFSSSITGSLAIAPYIPAMTNQSRIPDAAIRLVSGTSTLSWDNIYDTRQFAGNATRYSPFAIYGNASVPKNTFAAGGGGDLLIVSKFADGSSLVSNASGTITINQNGWYDIHATLYCTVGAPELAQGYISSYLNITSSSAILYPEFEYPIVSGSGLFGFTFDYGGKTQLEAGDTFTVYVENKLLKTAEITVQQLEITKIG